MSDGGSVEVVMIDSLKEELQREVGHYPTSEGWYSSTELRLLLGRHRRYVEDLLARKKDDGMLEVKKAYRARTNGRPVAMNVYRFMKEVK